MVEMGTLNTSVVGNGNLKETPIETLILMSIERRVTCLSLLLVGSISAHSTGSGGVAPYRMPTELIVSSPLIQVSNMARVNDPRSQRPRCSHERRPHVVDTVSI